MQLQPAVDDDLVLGQLAEGVRIEVAELGPFGQVQDDLGAGDGLLDAADLDEVVPRRQLGACGS